MVSITSRTKRRDGSSISVQQSIPGHDASQDVPPWVPVVIFLLAAIVYTGPALVNGGVMTATDILVGHAPYNSYLAEELPHQNSLQLDQVEQLPFPLEFYESLRAGDLQLWEPDVGGGVPMFTAVYNRLLVPWNLVQLVVPGGTGVTLGLTLAFFGCQLSTYGLARRLGLRRLPATLAAVAYTFSGPVTALVMRIHETLLAPLLFYAIHGAVRERRARWIVLTASATTMVLLGGFPAGAIMTLYGAGAWLVWLMITSTSPREKLLTRGAQALRSGWLAIGSVGAGAAVASVQLLPSLSFLSASGSLERSYPIWYRAGSDMLASAVSGRFHGAFQDQFWWWPRKAYANPVEASITAGLIVLMLIALLAVRGAPPEHRATTPISRFFLPLGIIVGVATYLGGPVLGLLQQLPFLASNSVGRARFFLSLALALAAALGLERLFERRHATSRPDGWLRAQLLAVLGAIALAVYQGLTVAAEENALLYVTFALTPPTLALLAALALRRWAGTRPVVGVGIIVLLCAELQFGSWGFTPASPPSTVYPDVPAFDVVSDDVGPGGQYRIFSPNFRNMRPNAAAVHDLRDVRVAWPSYEPYRELLQAADPRVFRSRLKSYFTSRLDPNSPILDRVAARYLARAHDEDLLEVGDPLATSIERPALPVTVPAPRATSRRVRGLIVDLARVDRDCRRGWVVLEADDVTSRRLLREVGEGTVFPLPDVTADRQWRLTSTDCPVALTSPAGAWMPVADDAALEVTSVEGWTLYERPSALPRASLAKTVETVASDTPATLAAGVDPTTVLARRDLRAGNRAGGTAAIVRDDPDIVEVEVDVDEGAGPGLLVLRDVAAPGWRASVDGTPAEIHRVDHAFRGVEVPTGESVVRFTYFPSSLRTGILLAVGGIIATAALALVAHRRGPSTTQRDESH